MEDETPSSRCYNWKLGLLLLIACAALVCILVISQQLILRHLARDHQQHGELEYEVQHRQLEYKSVDRQRESSWLMRALLPSPHSSPQ